MTVMEGILWLALLGLLVLVVEMSCTTSTLRAENEWLREELDEMVERSRKR